MPETPTKRTDRDFYIGFIGQAIADLNCWIADDDTDLWHYTTAAGFLGIIDSGKLFATQVACLNDSTEIIYAERMLRKELEVLRDEATDERVKQFLGDFCARLQEIPDFPSHRTSFFFVSCFTRLKDDLSQWRSYSGGEGGIAIRFKARDLRSHAQSALLRVNYQLEDHQRLAKLVAAETVRFYTEGLAEEIDGWDEKFLELWTWHLQHIAPGVKDPGFAGEQEVRLVYPASIPDDYRRMVVRQKRSLLAMHIKLEHRQFGHLSPLLPIQEVMVGPGRHKTINAISADTALKIAGYPPELVTISERPFQDV